ncbi:MAG: phosphopantetheine-binding protein [Lachnospiraceae bacterium]|nr:phosphopantetheine-binding protein [Lachnospiraceae bacterium]
MDKLRDILLFADEENKEEIAKADENTDLATELGLTSVKMLYMVIAIEETFDIRFENVGFNDFKIMKDIVDYIETNLK